jgi:Phytanoyl-CoA dioxygenase (PhyH)
MSIASVGRMYEERYLRDGFVVLHAAFDARRLTREVLTAFEAGFGGRDAVNVSADAEIAFRYVPMMSERAPYSLELLHELAEHGRRLLGTDVLPVRAKAVEYLGSSNWHRDSDADVASIGFACYLEPLTSTTGALRVVPGSHRLGATEAVMDEADRADRAAVSVETVPGDVIAFDEHLLHSSAGGGVRHQWRVDFVARPVGADERERVARYFAAMFSPDWDGGYDIDLYPTYGAHWRRSCSPTDDELLEAVGAYAAADQEEATSRRQRRADR